MRDTKLILVEGIPGSGKSTLAQFITQALDRQNIACRWWYEEEKGHPLYVFHDQPSLQQTSDALANGRHQQIIEAVLGRWSAFAQMLQESESIALLDGCLFGYLTWSLFPLDIPEEEIRAYAIESLPFLITFEVGTDAVVRMLSVAGPELLFGTVACLFVRE